MVETFSNATTPVPGSHRTVLLAVDPEHQALKTGIYGQARRAGWRVIDLRLCGMTPPRWFQPDGLLFELAEGAASLVRRCLRMGLPIVQIDDHVLPDKCCCVVLDLRALGEVAAEHFAERGFQNVAYLHSEAYEHAPFRPVGDSFVKRARDFDAKADLIAIQWPGRTVPWTRFGTLVKRFGKEIAKCRLPLGIFTYHDMMAARLCQYCDALGLRVPEQVAVLGIGNSPYQCDFAWTPLSSVDRNAYLQGRTAADLLDRLMAGEPAPKEPILIPPAGIVTRRSTDVLALPDVETATALRYIWEHLPEPLNVAGIAEAVGISRRKLERHFRTHLHRSVNDELTRKRIERCCELLVGTRTSVKAVAEQVGFSSEKYLFKVFHATMGTTPRQYRLARTAKGREGEGDKAATRHQTDR